jgi:hypothetical protein
MWDRDSATKYLDSVTAKLAEYGLCGEVIGSVEYRGWSNNDLDVSLSPIDEAEGCEWPEFSAVCDPEKTVSEYVYRRTPDGKLVHFYCCRSYWY